ncbi:MAG: hypothetical protein INQ03_25835 [Candidatus Heimdallarchaeota archaeon]|nr:hypothetical protein [Candidatus Heimdallarchaeota archaeon]
MSLVNEEVKGDKIELEFRFYSIITFFIFPLVIYGIIVSIPAVIFLFPILAILLEVLDNPVSRFIKRITMWFALISFGIKVFDKKLEHFRFWWFFAVGYLLGTLIMVLVVVTSISILPILLILFNRKKFLRFLFSLYFLPRADYIWSKSFEDRQRIMDRYSSLSEADKEYLLFDKPKFSTHLIAALIIILSPAMISLLLAPISVFANFYLNDDPAIINSAISIQYGLSFAGIGLIPIIAYLILLIPIRGKNLSKFISQDVAGFIVKSLASTGLNAIPYFKGEYYLEAESEVVDMGTPNGFFEIFRRGRLMSLFLTPLAIMSLLLNYLIEQLDQDTLRDQITISEFLKLFRDVMQKNPFISASLMIIIPVSISIILPLIWSINDAEIKRTSWRHDSSEFSLEIYNVEDLGTSIDSMFKLVIGISAITNLSSAVSLLVGKSDSVVAWTVTGVILVAAAIMVIPGALFMSYMYFSSGTHVDSVNYLRYTLSQESDIAVGTITRNYFKENKLSPPPYLRTTMIQEPVTQSQVVENSSKEFEENNQESVD